MADTCEISNVQAEMMFVGCLYKKPELILEVENVIKSEVYFCDTVSKFFYESALILYSKNQSFSENTVTVFMTQDEERLSTFKRFGGLETIRSFMEYATLEDFQAYYEEIKKYSLVREYTEKGFDTSKIRNTKKFVTATANDVYYWVRQMVDRVHTSVLSETETEYISNEMGSFANSFLEQPDMGAFTPFPEFNEMFRGLRLKNHMSLGMISNSGKTRFMVRLAAYNSFVQKNRSLLLVNEMSIEEIRLALLTTVINGKDFQELHGVVMRKPEREISLGLYRDKRGDFVYRKADEKGAFTESLEEYKSRLMFESEEYRNVQIVSSWIEETGIRDFAVIDVSGRYDDKSLETQIRKNSRLGFNYIFYDTAKSDNDTTGEWAAFKRTMTLLTEIAKNEEIFLYTSIQLLDEVENIEPLKLNSNQIANAKQIRHVLDSLVLSKEIDKDKFGIYRYYPNSKNSIGDTSTMAQPLPESKNPADRLYAFIVNKNRAGKKDKILFKVNLDENTWESLGLLVRA
jgi:replicative DNA helicase